MPTKIDLEFRILQAEKIHNGKYKYHLIEKESYKATKKVPIVCEVHGTFYQTFANHIRLEQGCPRCVGRNKTLREWVTEVLTKNPNFKDLYDYSQSSYEGAIKKIEIFCKKHRGFFKQRPADHLGGFGCHKCSGSDTYTTEEYIDACNKRHRGKYTYEKVTYLGNNNLVTVSCPKHGDFNVKAKAHIRKGGNGCSSCYSTISKEHWKIIDLLLDLGYKENEDFIVNDKKILINYITQRFLELDIYFPKLQLAIEVDGHFYHTNHLLAEKIFGKKEVEARLVREDVKNELCIEKKINLLRFTDIEINKNFSKVREKLNLAVLNS